MPISGQPEQLVHEGPRVRTVAVLGPDYHGMKPTMAVQAGDRVAKGQLLFYNRKTEGVQYTAPVAGTIAEINRGPKRVLLSVVIDVEGSEEREFARYDAGALASLTREQVRENLTASGLWTSLRTRPYSKVPSPETVPHAMPWSVAM
mgnify:CR=1 FL=1